MKKIVIALVVIGLILIPTIIFLVNQAKINIFEYNGFRFNYREDEWELKFDEPKPIATPEWNITQGKLSIVDTQLNAIELHLSDKTIPNIQAQMDIGTSKNEIEKSNLRVTFNGEQDFYFYCQQLLAGETACELKEENADGLFYTYRTSLFGMGKSSISLVFKNNEQYVSRKLALISQLVYIVSEVGN